MTVLTTERLKLEELVPEDAAFALELLNDPDFIANVADRGLRTIPEAEKYLIDGPIASYREHGFGMYAIRRLDNDETIGMCGLVKRPGLEDIDIGYGFLPAARGHGFAREAARAVFDFARGELGLTRIVAIVSPGNAPSITLLENLGMHHESMVRLPGEEHSIRLYAWPAASKV
jgi:ribosomal-protein-alanine N-acetyltransferase